MTLSVFDAAREAPDRDALVVGGVPVSFGMLAERVGRRLSELAAAGVSTGDGRLVGLVGSSDVDTLETVYALITVGQPMLLLHPRLTETERRAVVELVGPALVLAPPQALDAPDAPAPPGPERAPGSAPAAEDAARCLAVLMTSGTTNSPKGVVLSRRAFMASARASAANLDFRDDDRWLLGLPIAHVGGLSILTRCLLARRAVVVPKEIAAGARLDAAALARTINDDRVTLASLVPTQLEWLLALEPVWKPPPGLRAILLGGAAARPALLVTAAERGFPVLTTYGLTEACSQVTTQEVGTVNRGELGAGSPMPGVEIRIVDGAIWVRGPTLFDGYLPAPAASAFTADGWFPTSDLGRLDDAGRLHVVGRRSELVITGGENVHPSEVEAVVERCPGVAAACAFGVPDDLWGEVIGVAIVPSVAGQLPDAVLEDFCRERLSAHRRPRFVALVDTLGTTRAGKLDRAGTRTLALPRLRRLGSL